MHLHTDLSDDEKVACTAYLDKVIDWYGTRNHLLAFNVEKELCEYRGDGNPRSLVRCSIGLAIPNRLYTRGMEMKTASAVLDNHPEVKKLFAGIRVEWLDELQSIHDKCAMAEHATIGERRDTFVAYIQSIRDNPQNISLWDCRVA